MNYFNKVLSIAFFNLVILSILNASAQSNNSLVKYVNPIIGTQKMGHTFPGATVPFGMVQLSPDTDTLQYIENGKYNPDMYSHSLYYFFS